MQVLSPLSTEFIRIAVDARGYTVGDIKACDVSIAIVPFGYEPSTGDWNTGTWADGDVAYALLLVGPGANLTLASKTSYDVWVQVTPPAPNNYPAVVRSGTIRTSGVAEFAQPAATYDLRAKVVNTGVTLGDDWSMPMNVTENGNPYDWTGAVVEGQVRATETSTTVLQYMSFDTSTPGVLIASLTELQVEALGIGAPYYSIRTTKNGITRTWVKGQLVISPAATQ